MICNKMYPLKGNRRRNNSANKRTRYSCSSIVKTDISFIIIHWGKATNYNLKRKFF